MIFRQRNGFSAVEVIIAVIVVALIALLGWKAWDTFSEKESSQTTNSSQVETVPQDAPAVNEEADLDKADASLDATQIDDAESAKIEAETNF